MADSVAGVLKKEYESLPPEERLVEDKRSIRNSIYYRWEGKSAITRAFDYEIKYINTKEIIVDDLGQRDVERRKAQFNKIMRTFDPNLVQDIEVAFIDGKYYCFDGQMTRKVLIARNGGKDLSVRCKVYCGMTKMDAAMMFIKQRGTTSNVDITDKIRVMANYGDKDAIDFIRITESNGLYISWTRTKGKNAIVAVSTLFDIFKSFENKDDYAALIRIVKNAWGGDENSTRQQILRGLAHFIQCYKGQYDEEILTTHLSRQSPNEIVRNASADRTLGPRKYAVQVWNAYNYGTRENKKLPNLL